MPASRRRSYYDSYGQALPSLVPADTASRLQADGNQAMRHYVNTLLDKYWADLCRYGSHARMRLEVRWVNGIVQKTITAETWLEHSAEAED